MDKSLQNTIIFILLGCCWIFNGFRSFYTYFKRQKQPYYMIKGKVLRFEEEVTVRKGQKWISFAPIFEYTIHGTTYQSKHNVSSATFDKGFILPDDSKYQIGQEVDIRVYEEDSIVAILDGEITFNLRQGILCCFIGMIIIVISLIVNL